MRFATCLIAGLLGFACSKESAEDCKIVRDDPSHAMARVSERHPNDPAHVAEIIERCVAPDGDECTRLDKIVHSIPSLMPSGLPVPADPAGACRGMPPEMRRCMLPSYVLGHTDECTKVFQQITKAAAAPINATPAKPPSSCDTPTVAIDASGVMVTSHGKPQHHDGDVDAAWLESTLRAVKVADCNAIELQAATGVRYQTTIQVLDLAVKLGFVDTALVTPGTQPTRLPSTSSISSPAGSDALAKSPVVIVTTTELLVGGKHVASIAELGSDTGTIAALAKALPAGKSPVILQADQATDMKVIDRVIQTIKGAGVDDILFAVKNK